MEIAVLVFFTKGQWLLSFFEILEWKYYSVVLLGFKKVFILEVNNDSGIFFFIKNVSLFTVKIDLLKFSEY